MTDDEKTEKIASAIDAGMAALEKVPAMLEAAFIAGFKESGEGWNGEYPFEGVPESDPRWDNIRERFRKFVAEGEVAK